MLSMIFSSALPVLAAVFFILWIYSIIIDDVSFIDAFWSLGFLIAASAVYINVPGPSYTAHIIMGMTALWALRLGWHLWVRWRAHGADKRYLKILGDRQGLRRHIFTLWFVFGLQGALILVIVTPIVATLHDNPDVIPVTAYLGLVVFSIGFLFEAIGDYQLKQFRHDPNNQGKVLDTGLWRYTRHPNYFGDACVWWGLWLISADLTVIFAPLLMTFILVKWSGKPLLERGLKQTRPDYNDYIERTSGFIPMPPKQ